MKTLVIIPARGGSKGVPGKNIKLLNGKPLIQYTIEAATGVFSPESICVTTDDTTIATVVESLGLTIPFVRPKELATDSAGTNEVLLHALNHYENLGYTFDIIVLLQATSPFRSSEQIKEALSFYTDDCDMVVSVKETKANPYYVLKEENENGWLYSVKENNFVTRQDCPAVYELNGAIYIINVKSLKSKPISTFQHLKKYVMDDISSHDIDSMSDWEYAEFITERNKNVNAIY